ncbi:MAG: TolC family outer membrane protein [Pseudodesulfovibrio sp.]|nr:TolC family outer membrane protein [Pseudodesulfovibrio sp.]
MKRLILLIIFSVMLCCPQIHAEVDGTISLNESVVDAIKQHPQIKSLLYNRDAVSKSKAAALGRFFPSLNLSSDYGIQKYNSTTTRRAGSEERPRTASDSTLVMRQNVFDGMDRYNGYESEKARLTSAESRLIDNVENVGLDAIRAHIDVVRQRKLVILAGDNIIAHQEVLNSIAERVAGGAGSMADEMQARGRVARAETTLVTYTGELRSSEAEYTRTVGTPPGVLAEPEYNPDLIPNTMDEIMEKTLKNNPKIHIYMAEVEVSEKNKNVVQSTMYPDLDIELSSRYTNNLDGTDTYLNDNRAMLALSWNLFNGGTDYNDTRTAKARIKEAKADLQDTTDNLTRQVATAWAEYETSVGQIEKHQEALDYSIESRNMYLMQFNVGQRSLLDVLDSINEVFSNSVLLETAKSNRNYTLYKFLNLQGNLVKAFSVEETAYDPVPQ